MASTVADVGSDLARLAGRSMTAEEFGAVVTAGTRRILPFDGWCLFGVDPESGLRTFQLSRRGIERRTADMAANESLMPDVNRYADLAHRPRPVGWLSRRHPQAATSFRLNEILAPQGVTSELRLALRGNGRLWGALVLFREDPHPLFDDGDADAVAALVGPLAQAVRRFPARPITRHPEALGQGVVLLDPSNRPRAISGNAQTWLDDLVPGGDDETTASDVRRVLYDAAHAVRSGRPERAAAIVRTESGRWLRVEGTALASGGSDVAVLMQHATVHQILPAYALHQGLTTREAQVVGELVDGRASKQIARRLRISLLTVNAHLTSIYRKCGVNGREELLGSLM